MGTNLRQTGGQGDGSQALTLFEGFVGDVLDRIGDGDGGQVGTTLEEVGTQFVEAALKGNGVQ